MQKLYLKTLGDLALLAEGPDGEVVASGVKGLFVPAYVASCHEAGARVDDVVRLIWPGSPAGPRTLSATVGRLRKTGGCDWIVLDGDTVQLDPALVDVDLLAFPRRLVLGRFAEALGVLRGPVLGDMASKGSKPLRQWADALYDRMLFDADRAFEEVVSHALDQGEAARALRFAAMHVDLNPGSERAWSRLVRVRLATGDGDGARGAYEEYRERLSAELGDVSESELDSITEEIRHALGAG